MLVACEFLLEELVKYLESYFVKEAHWLCLHFALVYRKCFQINMLQELQNWCNDILVKYPIKVFDSEDFTSLQENALISLIKRDDLQMEEIKIWNYVIKWGIAQHSNLPSDAKDWSNENFKTLKITLQNFLPHIRYFQISGDDIYNNVKPFKQILEKTLWNDIKIRLMALNQPMTSTILSPRIISAKTLPTRCADPFSKVINEAHAAEIASWIDNKSDTYSIADNPYEFKLLLRGSRDGFTVESFWNLCNKKTKIVVVVKVKDSDEILGGYNPIGWEYSDTKQIKNCNECFIFSLKNGTIKKSILSRIKNPKGAIGNSCNGFGFINGFAIGGYEGCCIYAEENLKYKKVRDASTYDDTGFSEFTTDEYEIFQILQKVS
ncbi:hypothetical protein C2G38_2039560 [Gigaspora rosea]|uniref:TLDc domain-containing protein n=1 Tax=Gigaspora rosea TaxID=44941 RepID=A0A397V5J6_9GLOM|nr:hypothetical protein C2G38_2039560 [Gigaspora rosea]